MHCRLSDNSYFFTVELQAIIQVLDFIESSNYHKFIIFSNSLSSLQAIHNCKLKNSVVKIIIEIFTFKFYLTGYQAMLGLREMKMPILLPRLLSISSQSDIKIPHSDSE
jgi:hypothetical protein